MIHWIPRISAFATAFAVGAAAHAQISFDAAVSSAVGSQPAGVATGDFDGDGDADVAVTTDAPDKVEILINNGAGALSAGQTILTGAGTGPDGIVARDVDCDGDLDLVVALHNANSVRVLTNSAGTFTAGASTAVGGLDPRSIASADLDGDGDADVVVANRDSADLSLLSNTGGVLSLSAILAVGQDPRGVALGDFDGNGRLDIAVAAHDDRRIDVLLNQGGGSFAAPVSLSTGGQLRPSDVVAADLDGNGTIDIAASTSGNAFNFASVFPNQGAAAFGARLDFAVGGVNPDGIVAADLDLDGDLDLATANEDSNNVSTLRNLGSLSFGTATTLAAGTHPGDLAAIDLDGRGSADLVAANRDSSSVSSFRNQAGEIGIGSRFCNPAVCNSSGLPGVITVTGSTVVANDSLILTASQLPTTANIGYFLMGTGTNTFTPPGSSGPICIAPGLKRFLPPVENTRQLAGGFSRSVGTTGPISGAIRPGSTWSFQAWHRDGMQPSNLTDAVSVAFQ